MGVQQEDGHVADVVDLCNQLEYMQEGTVVSYNNKRLYIPPSFSGHSTAGNRSGVAPVWPHRAPVRKENVEGQSGLFSLQPGAKDAVVCQMNVAGMCIQDVSIRLEDKQCILLDSSCAGAVLQNVTFEGVI